MKVSYANAGAGSYTTLFDESTGATLLADFSPAFVSLLQQTPLAGGDQQFRAPRGNITVTFPLVFNQEYASRALCLASIATFAALLDVALDFKVEQDATIHYYPNAVITGFQPHLTGVSATHTMNVTSDPVTTTDPGP